MSDYPRNISASIHDRLANEAKNTKRPFGEVLQYYGIERFLYRLSKTRYADKFILKGGLIFYSLDIPLRRPTKDIDFLGLLENQKEIINEVLQETISISVQEDGIHFDPASVTLQEKQVDADRKGMRAKFLGYLGTAEIPMQIDFGFSDAIASEAEVIDYPVLLHNLENPRLRSYPIQSVIAEKFHTMQRFATTPSRWNDYYDIWLISDYFELDDKSISKAIEKTFQKRATQIPIGRPVSLTAELAFEYDRDWKAFLIKNDLNKAEIDKLLAVVELIWTFLEYPLLEIRKPDVSQNKKRWIPSKRKWE